MKKHELLKYAYDNYPRDTVAVSLGKIHHKFKTCGVYDLAPTGIVDSHSGWYIFSFIGREWSKILDENKLPKAVEVKLFKGKTANVHVDLIRIFDGNNTMNISPSDLEDMLHAYKSLQ